MLSEIIPEASSHFGATSVIDGKAVEKLIGAVNTAILEYSMGRMNTSWNDLVTPVTTPERAVPMTTDRPERRCSSWTWDE